MFIVCYTISSVGIFPPMPFMRVSSFLVFSFAGSFNEVCFCFSLDFLYRVNLPAVSLDFLPPDAYSHCHVELHLIILFEIPTTRDPPSLRLDSPVVLLGGCSSH